MMHNDDIIMAGLMLFLIGAIFCGVGVVMAAEDTKWVKLAGKCVIGVGVFLLSMPLMRLVSFFITG